ncbi:UNVERIFIED_CONTAM: hypothetical protein GTU68_027676 [Idotea baltica]|nr:hypothetical protein [Idotea baltica]
MAGFVGNHVVVALINNYLPISDVQYFTKPQGLETKPKLAPEAAKPLYNLIMQTNLHPVYIAMTVEKSSILLNHLNDCSQVLKQMSEKEVMRSENVNEVLKTLDKELNSRKQKEDENSDKKDKLIFEGLIKKWLIGRASDGFEEYLEFYVRDAIKAFPYVDMPLFLQLVRNVTSSPGDYWAVDVLHGVINGQKGFDDAVVCSTCGSENPDAKKCSKCKAVQYCDRTCQRLHWHNHKKFCEKCKVAYEKKMELEEKREKEEEEKQMMNQMNSLMAQDGGREKFKADIIKNGEKSDS